MGIKTRSLKTKMKWVDVRELAGICGKAKVEDVLTRWHGE